MLAPRKVLDICVAAIMSISFLLEFQATMCRRTMRLSCALRYKLLSQQQDRSLILIGDLDQGKERNGPTLPP